MSERVISGRHRVSPSPGKGSAVAYSPCPRSDDDMPGNVLAIPMSSIQTGNSGKLDPETVVYIYMTCEGHLFLFALILFLSIKF